MKVPENNQTDPKPFVRWVGGKSRLLFHLEKYLPTDFPAESVYYEPFLGSGSLLFHLQPNKAIISDNNKELIDCYQAIKENPKLVSRYLKQHFSNSSESYYYQVRENFNSCKPSISRASMFIYLNKTCFNGIYRVNKAGKFNVPYGFKEPPYLPSLEDLLKVQLLLKRSQIIHCYYSQIISRVKEGDFVYLDPPYPPLNGTSNFTHYTADRFSLEDHRKVSQFAEELNSKGCKVLISNAATTYIYSLYKKEIFHIYEIEVTRWIKTNGERYKVKELAITNYEI
jgi:DNA adenine methylase